jgi:hypothetical protein
MADNNSLGSNRRGAKYSSINTAIGELSTGSHELREITALTKAFFDEWCRATTKTEHDAVLVEFFIRLVELGDKAIDSYKTAFAAQMRASLEPKRGHPHDFIRAARDEARIVDANRQHAGTRYNRADAIAEATGEPPHVIAKRLTRKRARGHPIAKS